MFSLCYLTNSEEEGEHEDKTIWYYSTKVNENKYFLLLTFLLSSEQVSLL